MTDQLALATVPEAHSQGLAGKFLTDRFWRAACLSIALCLIWGVGLLCVFSLRDAWQAGASAEHAQDVRFETERLSRMLRESETGQRGFLLTGNTAFLDPFYKASKLAPIAVARLRELTADNPNQQRRLDSLKPLITTRLDSLLYNITKRQTEGPGAIEVGVIVRGKAAMDGIETLVSAMIEEESVLYRLRSDLGKQQAHFATMALLLGLLLSTVAISVMFYLTIGEIARRRRAESGLKDMNATLEQNVAIRTAELNSETEVRREAEEKLQGTTAFLDAVIEHIPGLLFVKDAKDYRFVLFNREGLQILGHERSELIGKNDYDFFPKEQADHFVERDREVVNSLKPQFTPEESITTRHNGVRLLQTTKVPVLDKHGQPQYLLGFSQDITEKKAVEQQLRQAVKMEAVGQLTGGIAHDFNNLLGVIIGNLDLLVERIKPETPIKDLLDEALDGALRGAELVQRLLAFSRKQSLQPAAIDLNERLPQIASLLRRTLGEAIVLKFNPGVGLWRAFADASQTEEAILNLAINARDAMPKGGTLSIETANVNLDDEYASQHVEVTPGDYVLLAVSDSGTGMSQEVLDRAFEPFFTTKDVEKGTGLGLSMVYGFVKQSGGHIKIYTELGHGTTVKIYLPRADPFDSCSAARSSAGELQVSKAHELILVVEDNERMRAVTLKQLADLGYRTLDAENAGVALAELDKHPEIDLLFTDIVMPGGMSGSELAREAAKRRPGLKVLLTSGYTAHAMTNGFHDIDGMELLSKPFRKHDLALKLRSLIDGR